MDEQQEAPRPPRRRRWVRNLFLIFIGLIALAVGVLAIVSEQYRGPRDLAGVTAVMPGVPIFPFADVAPNNRAAQRTMAIPLLLLRKQGARQAETALLQVPADRDFIRKWYQQTMPFQGWEQVREDVTAQGTRIIYLRRQESVQVYVGKTHSGMQTNIQLTYLDGLQPHQIEQLRGPAE